MSLLKKHEIKYIHSFAKSAFHLSKRNSNRDPKDIVDVRANKDSVEIRYGGFYGEDTAKRTFHQGEEYAFSAPELRKVRSGFYSVGWIYDQKS
jgi:hypothetical protein